MAKMQYFPIFLDLKQQDVLVVGGGSVGERKARLLLKAGARVHLVGRLLTRPLRDWAAQGRVTVLAGQYRTQQLDGKRLVFAATGDDGLNRRIFEDAEARSIPVNVVDDSASCRFISPAIVDRSPILVAICSGGTAPVLARRLKSAINALLPQGLGAIARAAAGLRELAKRRLPPRERRRFWERCLDTSHLHRWSTMPARRIHEEMRQALLGGFLKAPGRVYLVGAGPGRPELLTLRALQLLECADVILHDRLVPDEILELARRDAERIFVGKKAGKHYRTQGEIHRIMVEQARRGRIVVRLKGGDPFVFGRGGEELEALSSAGLEYEVVPGITAALGCAAYTGIPLTHRDHAQSVTFITGHTAGLRDAQAPVADWATIAGPGKTVVVYMGVRQAGRIKRELLNAGIERDFPLALVADGTRAGQQLIAGCVDELPALARRVDGNIPALLIIGQVTTLASNLGWFNQQPTVQAAA